MFQDSSSDPEAAMHDTRLRTSRTMVRAEDRAATTMGIE
jgi:hypothetical protein